jgi:3-phosphoshikimate 1-carboxyvinyltransferase
MSPMIVTPARRVRGKITLPGDKSISHRAAMLSALADGATEITNYSTGADCASTLRCLEQLGVRVTRDGATVRVHGRGRARLQQPAAPLDCGNSGSTMRMLAGLLASFPFAVEMIGDASLSARPMRRIITPLEQMGARVEARDGHAPLRLFGTDELQPISYRTPVASAQIKSCVLFAGLGARGRTSVAEDALTRDHSERMLRWLGAEVRTTEADGLITHTLDGPARLAARPLRVPGDASSAAFFVAAAAMLPGSDLTIENVGLNPTRTQMLPVLQALGVEITIEDAREECGEPVGTVRVRGAGPLAGANVLRAPLVAPLIDELPVLAVLGAQVAGGLEIRDAAELRVKESDRIATTAANLRAMGAEVEEFSDGLRVAGPVKLHGARICSYHDHRIAMAFAVAALVADGATEITGAESAGVSFPEFFALLKTVCA